MPDCRICLRPIEGRPDLVWTYDLKTGEQVPHPVHAACRRECERWMAARGIKPVDLDRMAESN